MMKRILSMILGGAILSLAMLAYAVHAEEQDAPKKSIQTVGESDAVNVMQTGADAQETDEKGRTDVAQLSGAKALLAGGKSASNLIDGKTDGSYRMLAEGEDCYAVVDLGAAYPIDCVRVYTYSYAYSFSVQGSADGVNYVSLGENTVDEDYDASVGYGIAGYNGRYRYIRVNGISGQYGYFSLYEIDVLSDLSLLETVPEEKLLEVSKGNTVKATLANGREAANLIDGKISGSYRMLAEGEDCYAVLDLGESYALEKVTVYTYGADYGFAVEGSADGTHFVPLGANDLQQEYDASKGCSVYVSGSYRYLRVRGTVCRYGYFSLYEIDVFSQTPPPVWGDLSGNRVVNVEDLNILLTVLATEATHPLGDLDGDGLINIADVNELLVYLATC